MRKHKLLLLLFTILVFGEVAHSQEKKVRFENGDVATLVQKKNLWGAVDQDGAVIIPQQYNSIETNGNYYICGIKKDDKLFYEAYSNNGTCLVSIDEKVDHLTCVKIRGHWFLNGHIDAKTSFVWDEQGNVLYKYKKIKDKQGFCSLINEVADTTVVETGRYTDLNLHIGVIEAKVGKKVGVLSLDGTTIIPATLYKSYFNSHQNHELHGFCVGLSSFNSGVIGYIDLEGNCVFPAVDFTYIYPLDNGQYVVKKGGEAGIADGDGKLLFMTKYNSISPCTFENGDWGYKVYLANGTGFLDKKGNVLKEPQGMPKETRKKKDKFIYFEVLADNGKYGIKSAAKKSIIPCIYDRIYFDEHSDCFRVYSGRYCGLIGKDGKIIIPCDRYEYISTVSYPFIEVEHLGKVGLCNSSGEEIIHPFYDDLFVSPKGVIYAYMGLYEGALSLDGKVLVPVEFTNITMMKQENDRYWFHLYVFDKQGYFDTKYGLVVPPKYTSTVFFNSPINYYLVKDGQSRGCFSEDGKMLIPTGLFDNVTVREMNDFGHKYLTEGYNKESPKERYYYDLQGNLVKALNYNEEYNSLFHEAHIQYGNKDYNKALELYSKAMQYKKTPVLFFNLGATYYNLEDFRKAIYYFENCEKYTSSANLKERSATLIADCKQRLKPKVVVKEKKKSTFWMELATGFLEVAGAVVAANVAMATYNTYMPSAYPINYSAPPTYYSISVPPAPPAVDWGAVFKKEKEDFMARFRTNYYNSHGTLPTTEEEEMAYTQFLQAQTASMNNSYNTQWDSSSSYNYDSGSSSSSTSSSSSSTITSRSPRSCGFCGGKGTIVDTVPTFGIIEKEYCSTCGKTVYNGHYHKTCKVCHGTGFE